MKRFTTKAVVVAVGVVCAGVAHAGSISVPVNDAAATNYAIEAIALGTTAITLPAVTYTMGVSRPATTNFTIIFTPATGSFNGTCPALVPAAAGGTASASIKRQSATECAYDVAVGAAQVNVNDTFTVTGLVTNVHTLNVAGSTFSVVVNLWDQGETARIDNSGPLTRRVASAVQAVNIYAATSDSGNTTADVNAAGGPLTGFLVNAVAPADTIGTAAANLTFDNNSQNAVIPNGVGIFDFTATAGTASVVLTGTATGAATNGFFLDLDSGGAADSDVGERFTLTPGTATLSGIPSTAFPPQGPVATRTVFFTADGTTQLGTQRNFAVSGTITPAVGSVNALLNTNNFNNTWWVWGANASQLMTPYFTTDARWLTRYFLLNTGGAAVSYSSVCFAETGNVITYGAARNGTLAGGAMTSVAARDVCTFAGNTRGSVIFTINAPINTVKGSYQFVDPISLNGVVVPMTRPYNQLNPTE